MNSRTLLLVSFAFGLLVAPVADSAQPPAKVSQTPSPTPIPSPAPASTSTPSKEIDIPTGVFVALDPPDVGRGIGSGDGTKHVTWQHNPIDGRLYSMGGDFLGLLGPESYRQEMYSLSIAERFAHREDRNAGWRLEYPYCGPDGGVQPKSPDFVGWTWDSKRKLFWMVPGLMFVPGSPVCPDRTASWNDDPKYLMNHLMTFDPAAPVLTQRLKDRGGSYLKDRGETWMSTYDPKVDTLIRFGFAGCCGALVDIYDIQKATWSSKYLGMNSLRKDIQIGAEMQAVDYEARVIYAVDGNSGRLHRYRMDSHKLDDLGPVPGGPIAGNNAYCAWDSVNRVLLFFRLDISNLRGTPHVYHPDAVRWESPPVVTNPPGLYPSVRHAMVFDPYQNVLALLGTTDKSNLRIWLYRYANRR